MNTSALTFSIFLVFLLIGCNDPILSCDDLDSPDRLIEKFSSSPEFEQLKRAYQGINMSEATVVEFNQKRVILLPVHLTIMMTGGSQVLSEGIAVKVNADNSFQEVIKVKVSGNSTELDSEFSGVIEVEHLTSQRQVVAKYAKGKLISMNRAGSASGRTTSNCNEFCELLECVGDKISQAGFIERLICGFDPIQCITVALSECLFLEEIGNISI